MATATDVRGIPIIDTDTHVVEPPDLWTSRVSSKWGDLVPHVAWDPVAEEEAWYSGAARLGAVGAPAMAGWSEHPPYHPRRFADPYLKKEGFKEGRIHLDGYNAMAFSRIRKGLVGGDFDRSANQQRVIRGIHSIASASSPAAA